MSESQTNHEWIMSESRANHERITTNHEWIMSESRVNHSRALHYQLYTNGLMLCMCTNGLTLCMCTIIWVNVVCVCFAVRHQLNSASPGSNCIVSPIRPLTHLQFGHAHQLDLRIQLLCVLLHGYKLQRQISHRYGCPVQRDEEQPRFQDGAHLGCIRTFRDIRRHRFLGQCVKYFYF